jgi:tRNA(Ile)-lysidine synthase
VKSELHHRVLGTIRRHHMIVAGDRVGVAVSGGADSVGLLRLIEDLKNELGIGLGILHLDHGLRGEASKADAAFVADLARARGLELLSVHEDVAAEAKRNHWNLEDAGRRARYSFFERAVLQGRCTKVAVAHTADDQAETVLGRIARGTGPRGIVGICPVRSDIVRPLLDVRRAALREYLDSKGQDWCEDTTNSDTSRLRARVRHELLPLLERDFNPAIVERLSSLSAIFRDEEVFWNLIVDDRIRVLANEIVGGFSIDVGSLLSPHAPVSQNADASRALSRRIVQGIFARIAGDSAGLQFGHVEDVLHLASALQSGRRVELPHGVDVVRNFDRLEFVSRPSAEANGSEGTFSENLPQYQYAVALTGEGIASIDIPELGLRFCLKAIDWSVRESDTTGETGVLDADRLTPPLVLRNWRPGDTYRLPGKRQALKLKRLFSDARIRMSGREKWPVLTSAGRIAWTRGWPPAAEFQASKATRRRVVVLEEKL